MLSFIKTAFDPEHRRRTLALLGVVLAAILLLAARHYRQAAQEARLDAREAQAGVVVLDNARRADGAALGKAEASKRTIRDTEELRRADTEKALAEHPAWSDEPVPADVLDSLRD